MTFPAIPEVVEPEKYIVTIEQLVKIVDYCVHMTIVGSGAFHKDWTVNVEEAIGISEARSTMLDKIYLEKAKEEATK